MEQRGNLWHRRHQGAGHIVEVYEVPISSSETSSHRPYTGILVTYSNVFKADP